MPKVPRSGYERLAQVDDSDQDEEHEQGPISTPTHNTTQPRTREPPRSGGLPSASRRTDSFHRRHRSNSGINLKDLNSRFEDWSQDVLLRLKIRKKKVDDAEQPEISYSVFQSAPDIPPATAETLQNSDGGGITQVDFEEAVESVKVAIELGIHPLLISQGSSGSYFARNAQGKTLAVFKPKDEEPYASKNPKWTKWIHRNLFPFFFGRACLIPNLSYISEAAAYVLDQRLQSNIVPYTGIVSLSSKSFHYDFWDRRAYYKKNKPLPEKQGSFQMFLKGYKDATQFFKAHPWPDQHNSELNGHRRKKRRRWAEDCRPSGPQESEEEDEGSGNGRSDPAEEADRRKVFWTEKLQQSLREQLERLVILDYIMRNTDRGLDNWMIKIVRKTGEVSIVADALEENGQAASRQTSPNASNGHMTGSDEQYRRQELMTASSRTGTPMNVPEENEAIVLLGAIDNSLSWPWKHPDAWRSYPFGWLFLPVSLIGQPFSESTRRHFLPLLTSKEWWAETQLQLRRCFMQDADFKERMYAKQIAVMKGQAWNVVETLKTPDHGPLELTRRARVYVWDDLVDVPVVLPMKTPSPDTRRSHAQKSGDSLEEQEEMDISAARASPSTPRQDLLGTATPKSQESGNPFNVSRQPSQTDVRESLDIDGGPLSPDDLQAFNFRSTPMTKKGSHGTSGTYFPNRRPPTVTRKSRMSYDEPRRMPDPGTESHQQRRRFSVGGSNPFLDEDDEGDLGYAATEDREGYRKRVIVERLEPVKSKHPFFTWC